MNPLNGSQPEQQPQLPVPPPPNPNEQPVIQALSQIPTIEGTLLTHAVFVAPGRVFSVLLAPDQAILWAEKLMQYGKMSKAGMIVSG